MEKNYRLQIKNDNNGTVKFFGNKEDVNDVLFNLWVDVNGTCTSKVIINIDDGINKQISNITTFEFFNIHGEISFKKDVENLQTQFNSQIPHLDPTKSVKFSMQSVF